MVGVCVPGFDGWVNFAAADISHALLHEVHDVGLATPPAAEDADGHGGLEVAHEQQAREGVDFVFEIEQVFVLGGIVAEGAAG